jgi:hypothetical protein
MPCVADPAGRGCAAAGAGAEADEVLQFPLDEGSRCRSPGAGESDAAEHAQAGSAAGAGAQAAGASPGEGVDLAARLVELPEEESDVCSICLDPYSDSDPAVHTCCKCATAALQRFHRMQALPRDARRGCLLPRVRRAGTVTTCSASCSGRSAAASARCASVPCSCR